jgi:DNA polymerase-1
MRQSKELAKHMLDVEKQAFDIAGGKFNLGSPKQIQEILYQRLGLPVLKKTPTGQPATSEDVLQDLALDYPLPKLILEYRSMSKLKSTYTDRLPEQINPDTGRVHTSYHQAVASTGRLSSTDPNLQNIPIRSEQGRRIRQAFVAGKGKQIVAADYSQIELRIMAHLSQDKGLLEAFAGGEDIHRATAAEVFGVEPEQVSQEERRRAKAINFGLIYGMSAFGLARQLGISRGDAQSYVDLYFERYPGVKAFMDQTRASAHDSGFVQTVYGRRLYLPEINSSNRQRRQYAERTAINAPMQGTAADIIKMAMIETDRWIQTSGCDIKMVMQVHDELVFEVGKPDLEECKNRIESSMTGVADLKVPLQVDVGVGANWDEAH